MTMSAQSAGPDSSQQVPLTAILTDAACQARVKIRPGVVRDYRRAMAEQISEGGLRFPPVVLFTDEQHFWLADGFHRILAARDAGLSEFPADVRPGTERDALLFSISCNGAHGLPRTNADKRKAVTLLLADAEWSQWSDREIARHCQVSHKCVQKVRRSASGDGRNSVRHTSCLTAVLPLSFLRGHFFDRFGTLSAVFPLARPKSCHFGSWGVEA